MNFVNLTPHDINIVGDAVVQVPVRTIEPSGTIARLSQETVQIDIWDGIPITKTVYGEVEDLPDPKEDTIYIVSFPVANHCKWRHDLFVPSQGVRNAAGQIVGCLSLGTV